MTGRARIRVGGVLAVIVLAALTVRKVGANQEEEAYQEQLRLARAEGMPTSPAEFAATMPAAKPSENAAPFYRELRVPLTRMADPTPVDADVVFNPNPRNLAEARSFLKTNQESLGIIDQAVLKPKCWFDRDWTLGYGVPTPELGDIKGAAKLIALRGSVKVASGDVDGALDDMRKVLILAKHAGAEPTLYSAMTREEIFAIAFRDLAYWAFAHRDQPAYPRSLKNAIEELPRPNVKREHSKDLYLVLNLVNLCFTQEGRKELEVDESTVPDVDKYALLYGSRDNAKAEVVRAERECWTVFDQPPIERERMLTIASDDLHVALEAFPTALEQFDAFDGGNDPSAGREGTWEVKRQLYVGALRALSGSSVAATIKTSDLLSPFSGKPLRYTYDGRQIEISTSGYSLEIPPNRALVNN